MAVEYHNVTLSGGTATVTFGQAFSYAPICVCTDTAGTAAAAKGILGWHAGHRFCAACGAVAQVKVLATVVVFVPAVWLTVPWARARPLATISVDSVVDAVVSVSASLLSAIQLSPFAPRPLVP